MNIGGRDRQLVTGVWILGILGLWEIWAFILQSVSDNPLMASKLPMPHTIIGTIILNWQTLLEAGAVTMSRAVTGFLIGTLVGVTLAILMSLSDTLEKIAFPYLIISQMIPVLGLAPIIFNIVRDMNLSRIVIAAYITFFPVSVNMLLGLRSVEEDKKDLLRMISTPTTKVYRKLMLPFSMSYLFTGLKIAAPMAVTASILVDMLGSKSGIGVKILYSLYSNRIDIFWASVIVSATMGILSYYVIMGVEHFAIPWKANASRKAGA